MQRRESSPPSVLPARATDLGDTSNQCGVQTVMLSIAPYLRRAAAALVTLLIYSATAATNQPAQPDPSSWPQWGGPNRDFISGATGLADVWPESGPPQIWRRPLGLGHSSIVAEEGRLFTMYRPGKEISRRGPGRRQARSVTAATRRVSRLPTSERAQRSCSTPALGSSALVQASVDRHANCPFC